MAKREDSLDIEPRGERPWRRLSRQPLVECEWLSHYADRILCSDGREIEFHALHYPMQVVGTAVLDNGRILLTRQYRYMVDSYDWELPAGNADPGEDLLQAALRETREETGYELADCRPVTVFYPQIGRSDHCFHLFKAGLAGAPQGEYDHAETFGLRWFTKEEARELIAGGGCRDGFALLALYMWLAGEL